MDVEVDPRLVAKFSHPAAELRQSVSWMSASQRWRCHLMAPGMVTDALSTGWGDTPGDAVRDAAESYVKAQQSLGIGVHELDVVADWENIDTVGGSDWAEPWSDHVWYPLWVALITCALWVSGVGAYVWLVGS